MQTLTSTERLSWKQVHTATDIVRYLQEGGDPRLLNEDGATLLHRAVQEHNLELCELVVKSVLFHIVREHIPPVVEEEVADSALHLPGIRRALRPVTRLIDSWFQQPEQPSAVRLCRLVSEIQCDQLFTQLPMTKKQLLQQLYYVSHEDLASFFSLQNNSGERASDLSADPMIRQLCEPTEYKRILSHWIDRALIGDLLHINAQHSYPLHVAALRGELVWREDRPLRDHLGNTPLHYAALYGRIEAIRFLVSRGASVTAQNSRGVTPIMMAVRADDAEALQLLLEQQLTEDELTMPDAEGHTALHYAARFNVPHAIHQLIVAGANPYETIKNSPCVVELAASAYSRDAQHALEEYDECCHCLDLFRKGEEGLVRIGRNCTHMMHRDCKQVMAAAAEFNRLCPLCCQPA